jgi:hypothetical protein
MINIIKFIPVDMTIRKAALIISGDSAYYIPFRIIMQNCVITPVGSSNEKIKVGVLESHCNLFTSPTTQFSLVPSLESPPHKTLLADFSILAVKEQIFKA